MAMHSNLQCFLDYITPTVVTQIIPKPFSYLASGTYWGPPGFDTVELFSLTSLWDQYCEWSAYGAGSRVLLPTGETVVQYFVPSLSGIQLYTNRATAASRNNCQNDRNKDEKQSRLPGTISAGSSNNQEGSSDSRKHFGHLAFEFFETCPPHERLPLASKVSELARGFPSLTSFTSADLSPASWMSVAWYPIYHIPARCNVKDLSACFLTYHPISPSFQDRMPSNAANISFCPNNGEKSRRVSLPPFGLATYKMQGNLWMNPEGGDRERVASLFSAADSWLQQLGIQHHDFNYFKTRAR